MRIPILTYHSLNARGTDYDSNDHDALELDLTLLKENGFRVERLTTLVDAFNKEVIVVYSEHNELQFFKKCPNLTFKFNYKMHHTTKYVV